MWPWLLDKLLLKYMQNYKMGATGNEFLVILSASAECSMLALYIYRHDITDRPLLQVQSRCLTPKFHTSKKSQQLSTVKSRGFGILPQGILCFLLNVPIAGEFNKPNF